MLAGAAGVMAGGALWSCAPEVRAGGRPASPWIEPASGGETLKAGELPEWWVPEPRASGSVVTVSASGTAPELSVARDLAVRNARAAGRAVLGVEPVRVEVSREASVQTRPGEFEAFVLARCDGAGAAALPVGGERARAAGRASSSDGSASAPGRAPTETPARVAADAAVAPSGEPAAAPAPSEPPVATEPAPAAPVTAGPAPDPSEAPVWWFEDTRRDGNSARACARAEGPKLVDTRRAAVEAVKERLRAQGVTGAVQTLFIATRKPPEVGYRVYVMGQGEVGK